MTRATLFALLALAACSDRPSDTPPEAAAPQGSTPVPPAPPAPPPPAPVTIVAKSDSLDFSYSWPAEAAAIAPLNADLRADADARLAEAKKAAGEDQREAAKAGYPFHQHSFAKRWAVAGENGALFSLVGTIETYSGGAHGMQVFDTRLFDRTAGRAIPLRDLFIDPAGSLAALNAPFCTGLDKQRAEKRGAPVAAGEGFFSDCPKIADQALALASSQPGGPIDSLRVLVAPYEAGPYAEGSYIVAVPLTGAITAGIKDAYKGALKTTGGE